MLKTGKLGLAVVIMLWSGCLALAPGGPSTASMPAVSPPEIHCKHFIYGYPFGAPATNDLVIRDLYALSSNDQTKFADWVCYCLTPHETVGTLDLERKWRTDPWLDPNETLDVKSDSEDDYKGADAVGYDRGHQAPLASFTGSRFACQVNFYSNITPQKSDLNEGPWMRLESKERALVHKYGEVWVMTGPLYEKDMPPLPHCRKPHRVPSGYWKIVVVRDGNEDRVAAFIMEQDTPRDASIVGKLCKVKEVENRSRLRFFWQLPSARQTALEESLAKTWVESWPD